LLFLGLFLACSSEPVSHDITPVKSEPLPETPPPTASLSADLGQVWRHDGKVEITNVFAYVPPGEKVLAVPPAPLSPVKLEVKGTESGGLVLAPVEVPAWAEAKAMPGRSEEFPFPVVIVHPASFDAKAIDPAAAGALPENLVPAVVKGAVDLDGNGDAEVVAAEWCCDDRTRADGCDLTCGGVWVEQAGGWARLREWQPE
jgi:hypothetical protein